MKITPDLINNLLNRQRVGKDISTHVADELNRISDLQVKIKALREQLGQAKLAYEEKVQGIYLELNKILNQCKHESVVKHPDPSGGSDSYHQCNICGASI